MAPNPTLPNLTSRSTSQMESQMLKITHINQLPNSNKMLANDLKSRTGDISNLSNLVIHSSQVLCSTDNPTELAENLDELEISNNNFEKLSQISRSNLKKLLVYNTMVKSLPKEIGYLRCLSLLNLSHNQLNELPDSLSELKYLESLDLSYNMLNSLPLSYSKLQRLKYLNLCGNKLKSLPECVVNGMGTLKVLNISENFNAKINVIPYSKLLEKFFATGNKTCCAFPDWIFFPKFLNLKELNLDKTKFDVYNFTSSRRVLCIKKLSISSSNLSNPVLEMMIEYMNSLEVLNVGNEKLHLNGNLFNSIPIQTFQHPELITEINFRGTELPFISEFIKQLCNLKKLDIGMNCISWFPSEICELQKLESLKIDGNGMIMLPENVGNLESLQELRANHNTLLRLPKSFKNLKNLKLLDLFDNVFEEFPDVLFEMKNLKSLDFEQNFVNTNEIMLKDIPYLTLRQSCINILMKDDKDILFYRVTGTKQRTPVESDESVSERSYWPSSDDEAFDNISDNLKNETDENWDSVIDPDEEFDPDVITTINHNEISKKYSHVYVPANKFCPADLHPNDIRKEVASMVAYGSLPSFKEEDGQFEDA